ncbi:MAG TPA: hypothetical protein VNW94_09205 [Streptosporangiaceae bacterium]|nr:hypothetical protein [Streptosporangiaceae bacterium]
MAARGSTVYLIGYLGGVPFGIRLPVQFSADGKTWSPTAYTAVVGSETGNYEDFSVPITADRTGYFRAVWGGSADSTPAVSGPAKLVLDRQYVVFNFEDNPPPAPVGSTVTFRGDLVRYTTTSIDVIKNATGELQFSANGSTWANVKPVSTSASDGGYSVSVVARTTGSWRVVFAGYGVAGPAMPLKVVPRNQSRILSFTAAPQPVKRGAKLRLSGVLQQFTGSWVPIAGTRLKVYFRAWGTKSPVLTGYATPRSNGAFTFTLTASRSGVWTVSFPGSTTDLPTSSPNLTVVVK